MFPILMCFLFSIFTVISTVYYGECSIVGDCKLYLQMQWSGSWIEPFKIGDKHYAVFGPKGKLHCYQRGSLMYAHDVSCANDNIIHVRFSDESNINLAITAENCILLHNIAMRGADDKSRSRIYSRTLRVNNKDIYLCFEHRFLENVPIPTDCPNHMKNYSINTRNFMFYDSNWGLKYKVPTVAQYEFLKSINHDSVVVDDYDYEHV